MNPFGWLLAKLWRLLFYLSPQASEGMDLGDDMDSLPEPPHGPGPDADGED